MSFEGFLIMTLWHQGVSHFFLRRIQTMSCFEFPVKPYSTVTDCFCM
jgi:hypothetical protein